MSSLATGVASDGLPRIFQSLQRGATIFMGLIRIILAFAVLAVHFGGSVGRYIVPADIAVQLFFVISGFYIAMILTEKYNGQKELFYKNRFLRLYPIYISVLVIISFSGVIIDALLSEDILRVKSIFISYSTGQINLGTVLFVVFSNLSGLFQDLILFFKLENAHMVLGNFSESVPPLHTMLIIPQAWSLSLEVGFYLIAPFLIRSKTTIIVSLLVSLLIKVGLSGLGYYRDPFSYRFFPGEISTFLFGSLGYFLYREKNIPLLNRYSIPLTFGVALLLIFWVPIFKIIPINRIFVFAVFALAIPQLFYFYKANRADNLIGELSYPFYLSHMFCRDLVALIFVKAGLNQLLSGMGASSAFIYFLEFLAITVITALISLFLLKYVQKRFDAIRRKNLVRIETPRQLDMAVC